MKAGLKRWQRVLLISLGSLVALILILALLVNQYWSPILAKRVKSIVLNSSDSLYHVDFSDAKLHILKGEIDIFNITLKPDTAIYNRRQKLHIAPNNLVELHVKKLTLLHIHPFKLYFEHELDIEQVILKEPEVEVSYQLNHTKDTTAKDTRTTWQKLSKTLRSVHIGEILLGDVKFKYEDYSGNKLAISELKEMNLGAKDMLIDSATQTDKSRVLFCRDIDADLNNYAANTPDGLYTYKIKALHLSTQTSKLTILGFDLQPRKPGVFFEKSEKDRFAIHLDSLELRDFDYLTYHKYRMVNASHLILHTGSLNLYNNPNKKPPTIDKVRTYPNFGLKELKASLNIDTIDAAHINIAYTELNHKSGKAGTITFNNSAGRFLNVTNNPEVLKKNDTCTAELSSYFMNRARVNVVFKFNLTDENVPFSYKGNIGPMDLHALNPAIMPLGLVKINTGKLNRFEFDINADNKTARGRVSLLYDSLKVTVLKADTDYDRLKRTIIPTLYANALVLKHSNPDMPGGTPRSFYVIFNRPTDYSFFKTIWHTLLTGIKPCIGLDEKMQKTVKDKIAQQSIKKQERKIKKAERKVRRAERKRKRELKKQLKERQIMTGQ